MHEVADVPKISVERSAPYVNPWENVVVKTQETKDAVVRLRERLSRILELRVLDASFPALHGIRVLAILLVVQYHATVGLQSLGVLKGSEAVRLSYRAFFGMDLFFVLSGFLIGTIAYRSLSKSKSPAAFGRFYARRALRTFAPYYVVLAALVLLLPMSPARQAGLLSEITFTANYSGLPIKARTMPWAWSLCVDEHFYLAVPLLVVLFSRCKSHSARWSLWGLIWLSALFVRFFVFYADESAWHQKGAMFKFIYERTHTRYDTLVAGLLVADVWYHFSDEVGRILDNRRLRAVLWSVSFVMLAALCLPMRLLGPWREVNLVRWGTMTSLMYVPILLLLLYNRGFAARFLSHRVFLPIATLGYGIYLVHIPVGWALMPTAQRLAQSGWPLSVIWGCFLAGMCVGAYGIAYALHLFVEKPMLSLRDKLVP